MKIDTKKIVLILFTGVFLLFLTIFLSKILNKNSKDLDIKEEKKEIIYKYGIPIDDYTIEYSKIKRNQTLSDILEQYLSGAQIYHLEKKSKGIFDVRTIQANKTCAVFKTKDSIPKAICFVYEKDIKTYVVFDLIGEFNVKVETRASEWRKKELAGRVEESLWLAMREYGANPQLAVVLANLFGWTIDFFGIQKGDQFKVIYEQEYVEDESLQNFNILAASFTHIKDTHYAVPFVQDNEKLYYDSKGHSLRGTFLKSPLDFYRISSRFSNNRFHPVLKRYRPHHGVDYAAPTGTPVYTIGNGKVIARAYQARGAGYYVKIRHNSMYTTTYMHLSRFAKGIRVGAKVKQKQVIGYVGSTGLSTGPHLDFRVYENGKAINPLSMKSQPQKNIHKDSMVKFKAVRDSTIKELKLIPMNIMEKDTSIVVK